MLTKGSWEAGTESNLTQKPCPDLTNLDYGLADFGLPYQHPRAQTGVIFTLL